METPNELTRAADLAAKLGIGRASRHVLLCADQTKPKCAPREVTTRVWVYLKRRIRELGLEGTVTASSEHGGAGPACVLRTKADCLRVCADGPICVVYPEGVWYRAVDEAVLERILQEHVLGGRVVEEHVIARAPWSRPERAP
jgi:(2Fe-2S) ferredoxin